MAGADLHIYRRRLPHWRLSGAVYFVTWRVAKAQPVLSPDERERVAGVLRHFDMQRYRLHAFVVMDDHVHVLAQPDAGHALERMVHSWKSYSAQRMRHDGRPAGPIWQEEYFDRIVRDEREFRENMRYIMNNPWKRWPSLEAYPWMLPAPR